MWSQVGPTLDIYPYMCEITPRYWLGNLKRDGLAHCLEVFESDRRPGLQALFHVPVCELARRFGRPRRQRLYHPWDLKVS